jgi:hypothetical protein
MKVLWLRFCKNFSVLPWPIHVNPWEHEDYKESVPSKEAGPWNEVYIGPEVLTVVLMMIMIMWFARSLTFWRDLSQLLLKCTASQPRRFYSSKHMFISYYQDAEQNHNIKMGNRSLKMWYISNIWGGGDSNKCTLHSQKSQEMELTECLLPSIQNFLSSSLIFKGLKLKYKNCIIPS